MRYIIPLKKTENRVDEDIWKLLEYVRGGEKENEKWKMG